MTGRLDIGGARDFDFLLGRWAVRNRRLKERLKGSDAWEEFDATLEVRPILDGLGNVDRFRTTWQGRPFEGVTLRLFNPATGDWSPYWVDNFGATLQPPLVGRFGDGRDRRGPGVVRQRGAQARAGPIGAVRVT